MEFVSKIEEIIDDKFNTKKLILASKINLFDMEIRIKKSVYFLGLIQFIAKVGSVLAIVNFTLKT